MKSYQLADMTKGWFIGNFEPTVLQTEHFEVGLKSYKKGDAEARHVHRISKEITVVVSGQILMNGRPFGTGDIVVLEPGEDTDFHAITDCETLVVKLPSVIGDKHFI